MKVGINLTKETIVKTFIGKYIDLSKVVSISDAYFIDRMGHGGFYVGFHIDCQLMDKPIEYVRKFEYDEMGKNEREQYAPILVNGEAADFFFDTRGEGNKKILAVSRLQKQIDDLVEQWREIYK